MDPAYRIQARFVPYNLPKTTPITHVLGDTENTPSPGYVGFTLNNKEVQWDVQAEGFGLFLNFRDQTSGKQRIPQAVFLMHGSRRPDR